jgi:hypothetical protein
MRLAYRLVHASRFGKPETAGVFKLVSFFPCQGSILPLDFYRTLLPASQQSLQNSSAAF